MKPLVSRGLLVLAVVLLVPLVGQTRPVPLKEQSEEQIRAWVSGYLALDTTQQRLEALDDMVRVDAGQITYRAEGGRPRELVWTYRPLRTLDAGQRAVVEVYLNDILDRAIRNYQGGLLSEADARELMRVTRYEAGPPATRDAASRPRDRQGQPGGRQGQPGGRPAGSAVVPPVRCCPW
jgi:hypothetical protein